MAMKHTKRSLFLLFIAILIYPTTSFAYDLTDSFSIEGALTTVGQHADFDNVFDEDGNKISDTTRGAVSIDIGANFHPNERNEFQLTYSFAEGEALNGLEAFSLAPFADDLEEDLSDINFSDRYNLLEAWYKHTFKFSETNLLGITAGIIDATGYIDGNEYANDQISQFMNDIFVNNTLANLPTYDVGAVLEFESRIWSLKALVMESENDDRNDYNYYALQVGHQIETRMGSGNYRIYAYTTNSEFIDNDGSGKDKLSGFGISFDQQISKSIGLFSRLSTQNDEVPVDHDEMISLGLSIAGTNWSRPDDTLAIAVAFLDGANKDNTDIKGTTAVEAYYKYVLSDLFDLTLDVQWIEDDLREGKNPEGTLIGLRFNVNY